MSDQAFIEQEKAEYSVAELCDALEVNPSSYYSRVGRAPSSRAIADAELVPKVLRVHINSRKTYGSPRVHKELAEEGVPVGRHRVARLMRENGLSARTKRRFRKTTDSNHKRGFSPNLLKRRFTADAPNEVWVGDITYIWTAEGWLYLAVLIDLFARRVVGWAIESHMRDELTLEALTRAIAIRQPSSNIIHHSDRGSQYASIDYRDELKRHGFAQSMSRKGDCWDNAVAESFFASLEKDVLLRTEFRTRSEARLAVIEYIEVFYNPVRRHSANELLSPANAERQFLSANRLRSAA